MKDNDNINKYMNAILQNGDASTGIGLLNSHTIPNLMNQVNLMR